MEEGAKAVSKRYVSKTDIVKAIVTRRNELKNKLPSGYMISNMLGEVRNILRIIETAPTVEIVHCRDCVHWNTMGSPCPMCHDETYDDDGRVDYYTVDQTPYDGSGFCHMGEKYNGK